MSAADLVAFRVVLLVFFRQVLPDPRQAEWVVDEVMARQRRELAGQTIPSRHALDLADAQARAAELLPLGASIAAQRQGVSRSTIYRRVHSHLARKAA